MKINKDDESIKLAFFKIDEIPESLHDGDEIEAYIQYRNNN